MVPEEFLTAGSAGSNVFKTSDKGNENMFDLVETINDAPVIKLIGVGGGGSNAVEHMVHSGIEGVEFVCANT